MAVIIRRLEESGETGNFDCGDAPLNNYLDKYAWVNAAQGVRILHNCDVQCPSGGVPQEYVRGLPNYDLPLILLARLAVDLRFAGKGIGHALISEAFRISLRVSGEVGCRCVITDAYRDRMSWYARYGFIPIEGAAAEGPQRMFLDIRTIRKALQSQL